MKIIEIGNMVAIALGFKAVDRTFLIDLNESVASRLSQVQLPLLLKILTLNSQQPQDSLSYIRPYIAGQLKQLVSNKFIKSMSLPEVLQTVTIIKNLSNLSFFAQSQMLRDHLLTELVSIV